MKFKLEPPLPTGYNLPDARLDMPSLLTPGRKPVGAVRVDWSHPVSAQLHRCYLPRLSDVFAASGGTTLELVSHSRSRFLRFGTNYDSKLRVVLGMESYYSDKPYEKVLLEPIGPLPSGTVFLHIAVNVFGGYGGMFFVHADYANNHRIYISVSGEISARPDIRLGGAASALVGALGTIKKGRPITLCVGWTEGNSNASVYVDGALVGTYARGTEVPGSSLDNTSFGYMEGATHLSPEYGCFYQASVWKRQLSDAEVASLHRDPYQFLIPA